MRNKGAGGIDKMTVAQLKPHLQQHWPRIRQALLDGSYMPQAVRAVDIPKPGSGKGPGGVRTLGIPTVVDRLIQQALLQVLQPIFEPTFSDSSHGFRPGRSARRVESEAAWLDGLLQASPMRARRWRRSTAGSGGACAACCGARPSGYTPEHTC